ncbi:hypothetical protein Ccrd_010011 [Cynara cardunculus var. scolymus]|uniref:Uncharacterized protein n=1 Tax=Cynara cardunculus var. scolymus TaxID=59895 RepID=A0A103YM15_CYNCS|nr:hypothetical protein Ccrd_010011 [Cynara cardunculus var. scolymus]
MRTMPLKGTFVMRSTTSGLKVSGRVNCPLAIFAKSAAKPWPFPWTISGAKESTIPHIVNVLSLDNFFPNLKSTSYDTRQQHAHIYRHGGSTEASRWLIKWRVKYGSNRTGDESVQKYANETSERASAMRLSCKIVNLERRSTERNNFNDDKFENSEDSTADFLLHHLLYKKI